MKIGLIGTFPPFRGGIAHYYAVLYQALAVRHDVFAVNFSRQYPELLFPGKTQKEEGESALSAPSVEMLDSVNPVSWIRTADYIASQQPDVVIFKYWMPFFAPAFGTVVRRLKRRSNARVLVICDNVIPHERKVLDVPLTRYFFDPVDHFIVQSRSVGEELEELYPEASYRYSPHPIYDLFGDKLPKEEARRQLGLDASRVMLYFGYIREYKGLDYLIQAASLLKDRMDDFRIVAVGDCYGRPDRYRDRVREHGVEDVFDLRIEFVPDEKVNLFYSAADMLVLPYTSATQSGVAQIAFHFDMPVVATDVGGLPEIVPDGKVGYVVPPRDPVALADALARYYEQGRAEEMEDAVREHKKLFTWDAMVREIEGLVGREAVSGEGGAMGTQ